MNGRLARWGKRIGIAAALAASALAAAGTASAGDRAQVEVIGFSPDGRFAAYEQYGVQDGSGFPYAEIFIIDLMENTSAIDEPIAARLEDDEFVLAPFPVAIAAAREVALAEARQELGRHGIVPGETGTTLVYRPYSDLSAPLLEVPFSIWASFTPYLRDENLLRITQTPTTTEICAEMAPGEVYLLGLELIQADGEQTTLLHEEETLPGEYFCATEYRIHSVVVYPPRSAEQLNCCANTYSMLVLLAVERFPGFEGPDYRFLGFGAMVEVIGR